MIKFKKELISSSSSSTTNTTTKEFKEPSTSKETPNSTTSSSKESITVISTANQPDYQIEGKKWKHTGDREKNPIKQYCKYLEAALYFIQAARQFERNSESLDKTNHLYKTTLTFLRSALQNKFIKSRSQHSLDENRLLVLGFRLLSVTIFHTNKIMLKEMRANEKHIRTQLASVTAITDPQHKPDQPVIVTNKIQMSLHLYTAMKKQFDHLSYYNESNELWQQTEHILDNDSATKQFFKKLNLDSGQLNINSNIDDLVPYVRNGLKQLNVDYS